METTIQVKDVHKKFKVYYDKGSNLKERVLFRNRNYYKERWVLQGIDFNVKKGEAIGLIGENGCGKSTLLKLMTRIMYPDQGLIQIKGRISSLIELGAGFHPDMSGRENIYTNASIFGLTRKEIDERIQNIIDFSELEEFIDNPVRTYSSGMYMRLAFSVAINVDADVLLIDEILAVGDANFQAKCFSKMRDIKANGTTIVIVSHSLGQIEQICERSIWIENGKIKMEGIPKEVHAEYMMAMGEKRELNKSKDRKKEQEAARVQEAKEQETQSEPKEGESLPAEPAEPENNIKKKRYGNQLIEIYDIQMLDRDGKEKNVFRTKEPFQFKMRYRSREKGLEASFGIMLTDREGVRVFGTNTLIEKDFLVKANPKGEVTVFVKENNLMGGEYTLQVAAYSLENFPFDDIFDVLSFTIVSDKNSVGVCNLGVEWQTDDNQIK